MPNRKVSVEKTQALSSSVLGQAVLGLLLTVGASGMALSHEGETHTPATPAISSPEAQAAVAVLQRYAAAMTSNDLTKIKPLLVTGNDFSFFEGTYVNIGWQSYYDHMAPEMKLFEKPNYRLSDIRAYASGDLAYATFSWAMDVTVVSDKFDGGKHPVSMHGKGTAVLSRIGGDWKIRHLQTAMASTPRTETASH
ncbi:MAG: nuclear transport factor 2 family protein [Gammaproteobacteria bacterium]